MDRKTLLEKVEEAARQPVPDESLKRSRRDWSGDDEEDGHHASGANPRHREDFTSLLTAATRRR